MSLKRTPVLMRTIFPSSLVSQYPLCKQANSKVERVHYIPRTHLTSFFIETVVWKGKLDLFISYLPIYRSLAR